MTDDWSIVETMILRTSPTSPEGDMSLARFAGYLTDSDRLSLSTLHSSKGREFDVVLLFAMNDTILPESRDRGSRKLKAARRLFYVGVTRARQDLYLVYQKGHHSPWVKELYDRLHS